MPNWIVVRTRPRWEKKVARLIAANGIEVFCPLIKERRKWSDRIKVVERPLLKGCVFVRIGEEQRTCVRLTNGVINFVYRNGNPVVIKDKIVQQIRQFQQEHPSFEVIERIASTDVNTWEKKQAKPASLYIEVLNIVLIATPHHSVSPQAPTNKSETCVSSIV